MNLKLVAFLIVAILIAHAVLIHLLIRTSSLTESVRQNKQVHSEKPFVPPVTKNEPGKTNVVTEKSSQTVPVIPAVKQEPDWTIPVIPETPRNPVYTWRPLN